MDGISSSALPSSSSPLPSSSSQPPSSQPSRPLVIIAATNRPNALDAALRRPGRFDREIAINVPGTQQREAILKLHARSLPLHADVDMRQLAARCKGYVGADLAAVCREAALAAMMEMAGGAGEVFSGGGVAGGEEERGEKEGEGGSAERSDGSGCTARENGSSNSSSNSSSCVTSRSGDLTVAASSSCSSTKNGTGSTENGISSKENPTSSSAVSSADRGSSSVGLVAMRHFDAALSRVGPSVTRGVAAELPAVTWDDVGGLGGVKKRLRMAVEWPLQHPAAFLRLGLTPPRGVLLHGPPGGGKTMLALAAAHASKATLFSLSGADLFSMYVGEGEAMLKDTFRLARMAAPSVVFVDEVDVVGGRRSDAESSGGGGGGGSVGERLLAALLTEMDGLQSLTAPIAPTSSTSSTRSTREGNSDAVSTPSSSSSSSVLVIAATNRFRALDPAIIRPGRFDSIIYVPPLDEAGRLHALQIHTAAMRLAADVSLPAVAASTALFTGADVAALCREAALAALRGEVLESGEGKSQPAAEDTARGDAGLETETAAEAEAGAGARASWGGGSAMAGLEAPKEGTGGVASGSPCVAQRHFDSALMVVRPSLSELEVQAYEQDA
ncbi:hypothetical protein CLOM_g5035 [Closterium sp. NIES-68]|nr:hypothetical protein CLOM_g5035 [Closterium sp. NIES-68]